MIMVTWDAHLVATAEQRGIAEPFPTDPDHLDELRRLNGPF
jgi:hypothetical protein